MLSTQTIEIIKATVPVLEVHGQAITTRFYQRLFDTHPELLNVFNHTNQKQGRQQAALANAVYAAAVHIDRLEEILPAVQQIAHKHRGLGVQPEHYPVVGENLLAAIKDVLGDAATDEILTAWGQAYGVIADAFISVEHEMYTAAASQAGGWSGTRRFIVARKVKESDVITSFYLVPVDGLSLAHYQPGQYLTLRLQLPDDPYTHMRQYSLSDAPGKDYYRISVKREEGVFSGSTQRPAGRVSNFLHDHVQEQDIIEATAPAGDFTLDMSTSAPLVLLSGGVGLTPIVSMLKTVLDQQPHRPVTYIHAALNSQVHALRGEIEHLSLEHTNLRYFVVYEQPSAQDEVERNFDKPGFIDLPWLQSILPGDPSPSEFYFCGPTPFMQSIYRSLGEMGIADGKIHYEFFGPNMSLSSI